jgi:phytanoyl-CoA hydroxylase
LGSPQVLAIAESLCGRNFVPTYESMVVKMEDDGEAVAWHQDAVFPRNFRVFNFDLYLDASTRDGGALRVIPGTQKQIHDVCKVAEKYAWDDPDLITVEMEPGDVLLHDDMVVHGSPRVQGQPTRRTIYFEFRPVEQILEEGPWDYSFIEKRMHLVPIALRHHLARYPQNPQFSWNCSAEHRPEGKGSDAEELRVVHTVHSKNSHCSAGGAL